MEIIERPKSPDYLYLIKYNGVKALVTKEFFFGTNVIYFMYFNVMDQKSRKMRKI